MKQTFRNLPLLTAAMTWLMTLVLLLAFSTEAAAQGTITRKKPATTTTKKTTTAGTTKKTTVGTATRKPGTATTRRSATTRRPARTTVTPRYEEVDSVATDDEDDGWDDSHLAGGFEIFGKPLKDFTDNASAQKSVREAISSSTNAKTGCLSNERAVVIFGGNGYNSNELPSEMRDALKSVNNQKLTINDVAVTDVGWWCVVYSDYHFKGNLPTECRKELEKFEQRKEQILSISISESGDYAIIGDNSYTASNDVDSKCIKQAIELYGRVHAICITNKGTLVTCSKGIFYVNVPSGVIEKLKEQDFTPTLIRFTDSGTYIAFDGEGGKAWYM